MIDLQCDHQVWKKTWVAFIKWSVGPVTSILSKPPKLRQELSRKIGLLNMVTKNYVAEYKDFEGNIWQQYQNSLH